MSTQVSSPNTAISIDLSNLAASSTFVTGVNSGQIDNTTDNFFDALVTVLGITSGTSAIGQTLSLYVAGQNVSFATNPIGGSGGIDGVAGACTLPHVSVLNSLRLAGAASVTVATAGLVYYIQPFSVAQLFGGIMPKFWCLYFSHNLTGNLAAAQSSLFTFNGITSS